MGIGRGLGDGHRGPFVVQGLVVLGPAGAPAAYHVQGGRARRPVYVRRGHLADLLTRPLGPPEPDPDLLHHLVHVRVVEAVAAAHLPDHRAETLEHRFDREGEMLFGFGQCHAGSIGLPTPRRQRSDRRSLHQRERLISSRRATPRCSRRRRHRRTGGRRRGAARPNESREGRRCTRCGASPMTGPAPR